jgi:membrane protease YdiL (CAAX protease family)
MNLNLKKQSPWIQLIIFGIITMVIAFISTFIGAYVLASYNHIGLADLATLKPADFGRPEYATLAKGLLVVQFFGIFLLPSLFFAWIADPRPLAFCGIKKPNITNSIWLAALIMLCAYFMVEWLAIVNQQIVQHLFGKTAQKWIQDAENERNGTLQNILNMKNLRDLLVSVILVGVFAAIGEEIFFRGILQRIFIQTFKSPWAGILVTAAIFSAVHGQFLGFLPRMILGAVLGALYWYSGSLITAIVGHFVFNVVQVFLVYFKLVDTNQNSTGNVFLFLVGIPALVIVIFLLNYMRKRSRTTYEEIYSRPQSIFPGE